MALKKTKMSADFTIPLLMNGLQGRMLYIPSKSRKRELLVIYGHHGSLERWWPLALELQRHGSVTMPDLPGFGGMQSFYRIHEKPNLDNFADYLASFVKLRYRRKRFTIVGVAFGSIVVTRMLERNPELVKKVDVFVSVGGFAHYDDLKPKQARRFTYRYLRQMAAWHGPALFVRHVCLHPSLLRNVYGRRSHPKLSPEAIETQTRLWRQNDIRTHFKTLADLMKLDNCSAHVNLPLWHVSLKSNQYLHSRHVDQHLRVIFSDVHVIKSHIRSQAIGSVTYNSTTTSLLPTEIHRLLAQKT